MGATIACFQDSGKIPVAIDELIIHVRYGIITGNDSFINRSEILSELQEEVFFKCFIINMMVLLSVG